jgi:hypothetical protein
MSKIAWETVLLSSFALDCFSKGLDEVFQGCILSCILLLTHRTPLMPNDHYNDRTAPLTSKVAF